MKTKGLTLMELVIVLAIMVIVALILVPMFLLTTDRSRLRADIQSANVIQNAIDLHRIERRQSVAGSPNVNTMVQNLADAGYIDPRKVTIQTENAVWFLNNNSVMVDITLSPDDVHRAYASLSDDEKIFVRGGDASR
ncbi:MAG: prepilin-type N-terminal cleavage/methylation domain-containing protein [Clostridiales bacterium]|jgi:prepilin-type N-terminal cleavage/methylation domain-containing protein|nr:prepilin-type N-terminal cleavage/methylation domain-containing protein [Clostridiales bacterium]